MSNVTHIQAKTQATQSHLDMLSTEYLALKRVEAKAKAEMPELEKQIIAIVGEKEEGTTNCETLQFKISTTGKINRKLEVDALNGVRHLIPEAIFNRLINVKPAIDLKELRYVEANEPQIYSIIARAITSKPAKTAIRIEKREGE